MAIDLNALRAKHQQLTNPKTGGGDQDFLNKFYQVKEGEAYLRIPHSKVLTRTSTLKLRFTVFHNLMVP